MENIYKSIGKLIKEHRKNAGMTQQELSEQINVTMNYLSLIENGRRKPTIETLVKLAKGLNVPLSKLFSTPKPEEMKVKDNYDKRIEFSLKSLGKKDKMIIMDIIAKMKKYRKK